MSRLARERCEVDREASATARKLPSEDVGGGQCSWRLDGADRTLALGTDANATADWVSAC